MADGALNLTLDDYASAKLAEKAKALGVSPERLAAQLLGQQLFDYCDFAWINGDPRTDRQSPAELAPAELAPAELEGARDWDDVRPEFLALIDKTFGAS